MQGPLTLKNRMLSTPLINISKASTPIRMRVVSNNAPLNSTPINQLKYNISPNTQNKQNLNSLNQTNLLESKKQSEQISDSQRYGMNSKVVNLLDQKMNHADQKIKINSPDLKYSPFLRQSNRGLNLSPIMALNRKMSQGPAKIQGFRSFTPGYIKRSESPLNISKQKLNQSLLKSNSIILQQKDKSALISASNSNSNLRKSNSFANLFQKRSNTPTRLGSMAFNSLSNKTKTPAQQFNAVQSSKMKQSLNFHEDNKLLSQMLCANDNKKIIKQSPLQQNFDQSIQQGQRMCFNNHGKQAKYRVITSEGEVQQELGQYVYCSKCAIDLVQKGFSVKELNNERTSNYEDRIMSQHTSPRQKNYMNSNNYMTIDQSQSMYQVSNLRQSNSFQSKFLQFKPSVNNNYENQQKVKTSERVKQMLSSQLSYIETLKKMVNKKCNSEIEQIDCYYNSMISYIEQQRSKDKQNIEDLRKQISQRLLNIQQNQLSFQQHQHQLQKNFSKIDNFLRTRNFNTISIKELEQIQSELNQQAQKNQYIDKQMINLLQDQNKRILYFDSTIQQQFDQFVTYLDTNGKLKYISFKQLEKINMHYSQNNNYGNQFQNKPIVSKNNALRFSFEKALKNQNNKKMFLQSQMNPLQQQSEQEYEQNSFNQQNNMMANSQQKGLTQMQPQSHEQPPFRTLFAEQDQIIQESEQEQNGKNTIYSPNFKSI